MRILFVSGVDVGGAPRSTTELADALAGLGHDVLVLLGRTALTTGAHELAVRGVVKLGGGVPARALRALLRPFGRAATTTHISARGATVRWVPHPENALRGLVREFAPQVVVANSFPRAQLQWMADDLASLGVPLALYLREEHALTHLSRTGLRPSLVLANSLHLTEAARALGVPCTFVPSVVDVSGASTTSSRSTVLLVNPVEENRPSVVRTLADRRPDIRCVLQESWPLDASTRRELEGWVTTRPNLELRASTGSPAEVYRDARLVVATYPTGRPRVVLEAQSNGIPVVALDQPALAEAVGRGGICLAPGLTDEEWSDQLERLWDDDRAYAALVREARQHAARADVDPHAIASQVEAALAGVTS